MTKALTPAQLAWNNPNSFPTPKPSPAPKGKIAPRNCDPAVIGAAANSTGPTCLKCGGPRGRIRGLHCSECSA